MTNDREELIKLIDKKLYERHALRGSEYQLSAATFADYILQNYTKNEDVNKKIEKSLKEERIIIANFILHFVENSISCVMPAQNSEEILEYIPAAKFREILNKIISENEAKDE